MNRNPKEFSFENMDITQPDEEPVVVEEASLQTEGIDSSDIMWANDMF